MYVDPALLKMEQEVNEATAALKSMLRITSSSNVANPALQPRQEAESDATQLTDTAPQKDATHDTPDEQSKSKKKKRQKKKKAGDTSKTPPKSTIGSVEGNKTASKVVDSNLGSKKKKNQKRKNEKDKKKKEKDTPENFAWSTFQVSPDASKLPIPSFSSPTQEKKTISVEDPQTLAKALDEPAVLDQTASAASDLASSSQESPEPNTEEKSQDGPTSDTAASSTGVNLAVLAAKPPPAPSASEVQTQGPAPFSSPPPAPPPFHQPHHHPAYPPPPPLPPPNAHSRPPHPTHHAYPPPPPPGYVTIQVQVPPVLMPGRQMVVASPAGYPVQVTVPEGIPPGMLIPVHVPAGPPLHMMPPPGAPPYPGSRYYNPAHR